MKTIMTVLAAVLLFASVANADVYFGFGVRRPRPYYGPRYYTPVRPYYGPYYHAYPQPHYHPYYRPYRGLYLGW